jgi:hypothetical protein
MWMFPSCPSVRWRSLEIYRLERFFERSNEVDCASCFRGSRIALRDGFDDRAHFCLSCFFFPYA